MDYRALVGTHHGRVVASGPRVRRATAASEYGISGIVARRGVRPRDDFGLPKKCQPEDLIVKFIFLIVLVLITAPTIVVSQTERTHATAVEEVLRTEREQRDAYLQRDIAKTERLVADEFIFTSGRDIGDKTTLLAFLKSAPLDPTLTLTAEDTRVMIFERRVGSSIRHLSCYIKHHRVLGPKITR